MTKDAKNAATVEEVTISVGLQQRSSLYVAVSQSSFRKQAARAIPFTYTDLQNEMCIRMSYDTQIRIFCRVDTQ